MPIDRTSEEYFMEVLGQTRGVSDMVHGVSADAPPETFADLQAIADATRNPACGGSKIVDDFVEAVAEDPDRDSIVRSLAYDAGSRSLLLVVPEVILGKE